MGRPDSQLSLPPMPVNDVSQRRETAAPSAGNSISPTAILVRACEDERGWQEKDAARSQGYEPPYWSRIKTGERPAQLERLALLPAKVQKRFVRRYARALGMEVREESSEDRKLRAMAQAQVALAAAMAEFARVG
jgi:hypothetical protein